MSERLVRRLTFIHDGSGYIAEVGKDLRRYPSRRVGRKSEIAWNETPFEEGPPIEKVVDAGHVFFVFQAAGQTRWARPFMAQPYPDRESVEYVDEG